MPRLPAARSRPRPTFLAWARLVWLGISVLLVALGIAGTALAQTREAHVVEVDGIISPITDRYITRALEEAERSRAEAVVITLDTPGGLLSATRDITETLLAAPVPVVVYVSPQGAHAASAGTFITAAGHIAAMAPRHEHRRRESGRRAGRGPGRDAQGQGVRGHGGSAACHR